MIKTVLVHLSGTDSDASVLATALKAAKPFEAHLDCLHIPPDPKSLIYLWGAQEPGSGPLIAEAMEAMEQERAVRIRRAREHFENFCAEHNIVVAEKPPGPELLNAAYRQREGDIVKELVSQSRYHDLVVVSGHRSGDEGLTKAQLGEIVLSAGRPVLLAPKTPPKSDFRTVAVAWKNSPEASRAITAAMPFLSKAHRILVMTVNEDDKNAMECLDCYECVANQLRWHGLQAEGHYVVPQGRTMPHALLDSVRERSADLLVMGAYSHSRARELVFGGFTLHVLNGADLPVLIFH